MPQAVSLSRALLTLARAQASGVLHVASERGQCRIAIADGVLRAAAGELGAAPALGDELLRDGALDARAHMQALASEPLRGERMVAGAWLVARGLVTRGAVQGALRRQLRARLSSALQCRALDYRFTKGRADVGVPWIEEPLSTPDIVLAATRDVVSARPLPELARVIEGGRLGLTDLGRTLLRDAALWPEEAVAANLLERGADLVEILRAARGSERVIAAVAVWTLLGAVCSAQRPRDGRYGLLVRKARQLRRAAKPHALLDLPSEVAADQARRALRLLASRVHPDGLGSDAQRQPELRHACNEVLGALLDAERQLSR